MNETVVKIIILVVMMLAILIMIKSFKKTSLYHKIMDNKGAQFLIMFALLLMALSYWVYLVIETYKI